MRRFNMSVAKIKNANGEYESIPALRDRSGYETAKANGYTGTEEQWMHDIYSDGWITAVQELDESKASKSDFEKFKSDVNKDIDNRIPPWNLDQNIGSICNGTTCSIELEVSQPSTLKKGHSIPIINDGIIRVKGHVIMHRDSSTTMDYDYENTYAKVYVNETAVYEIYAPEVKPSKSTLIDTDLSCDIVVNKGDILSFVVSASRLTGSTGNYADLCATMSNIEICANIETPFTYYDIAAELENPSTTEIRNKLLA